MYVVVEIFVRELLMVILLMPLAVLILKSMKTRMVFVRVVRLQPDQVFVLELIFVLELPLLKFYLLM